MKRLRVTVCRGPECGSQAAAITAALREGIARLGLADRVVLDHKSCYGRCRSGPNLVVAELAGVTPRQPRFALATMPTGGRASMYNHMTPEKAVRALEVHALALFGPGSI